MSFWRYFKGKLKGLGYLLLGVAAMVAGAALITAFGIGNNTLGQINLETAGCAAGLLFILVGGLVLAYGQQHLKKLDEN